jgi:hypothetical protein
LLKHGKRKKTPGLPIIIEDARSARSKSPFKPRVHFASTGQFFFFLFLAGLWIFSVSVVGPLVRSHWSAIADGESKLETGLYLLGFGAVAVLTYRRWERFTLTAISVMVAILMQQAFVGKIQAEQISAAARTALQYCLHKLGDGKD